jgi:hypothetical protein
VLIAIAVIEDAEIEYKTFNELTIICYGKYFDYFCDVSILKTGKRAIKSTHPINEKATLCELPVYS